MLTNLGKAKRLLAEVDFRPRQGDRFQPTGFADIGAATYQAPDGTRMLLVESAQSMANHLESAITQADGQIVEELAGTPYVRVQIKGESNTVRTSLNEAHRLNSPWVMSGTMADGSAFDETLRREMGVNGTNALDWAQVARTIFKYDVNSLIHGSFLVRIDGRIKMPRALSAFIEAEGVQEVSSGGAKFDQVDPTGKEVKPERSSDKDWLGNVPFHRLEYTARSIKGYFNLDIGMLQSLGLGDQAVELLASLSVYKILRFLRGGTRLRTACDLKPAGLKVTEPEGFVMPDEDAVLSIIRKDIAACRSMFADPAVTELISVAVAPATGATGATPEQEADEVDE